MFHLACLVFSIPFQSPGETDEVAAERIGGDDAVGAEGTFSAGDFLGGDAGTKKADY